MYISADIVSEKIKYFTGTHFYIISKEACVEAVKNAFPIDIQTDWYLGHLGTLEKVNVEGFVTYGQKFHKSGIQDPCLKCSLPNNFIFYLIFIILFIVISIACFRKCIRKI